MKHLNKMLSNTCLIVNLFSKTSITTNTRVIKQFIPMKKLITLCLATLSMATDMQAQYVPNTEYSNDGKHRGLDFNVMTGYHIGVGKNKDNGSIPFEVGLGKQFHPNIYLGLTTGAWIDTSGDTDPMIPIAVNTKIMFPRNEKNAMKPFIDFRLGYLLNTASDITIDMGEYGGKETISMPDYVMMEIMPGIQIPMTKKTDFLLALGYTHGFATKGGNGAGFFTIKAGLNFHKTAVKEVRYPREKVPTRNRGFQLTFEAGGSCINHDLGGGGNIVATAKLNPHFSVGGGLGYEKIFPNDLSEDNHDIQFVFSTDEKEDFDSYDWSISNIKAFARGVYRVIDRKFSPFVSIDAGATLVSANDEGLRKYNNYEIAGTSPDGVYFFTTPAVGVSMRTTKNSYLELKAGFTFIPNLVDAQKGVIKKKYDNIYYATRGVHCMNPFVSFGFTHTFGKRGKRVKPAY